MNGTSSKSRNSSRRSLNLFKDVVATPVAADNQTSAAKPTTSEAEQKEVACPHKDKGCKWVGDENKLKQHTASCKKRPWRCKHCDFISTSGLSPTEHVPKCQKYPITCPNQCSKTTMFRCDLEKHLSECPLQLVDCKLADTGCGMKVIRKDLKRHMEEARQSHLLCATLLNIKLTREKIAEKDRQLAQKDEKLAEKDKVMAEKDRQLAEKNNELLAIQMSIEKQTTTIAAVTSSIDHLLMLSTCHKLVLREFTECQRRGHSGDWFSDPFYSQPLGYKLRLHIATNGATDVRNTHLSAQLHLLRGDHDAKQVWPVTFIVTLRLLNQLDGNDYHEKTCLCSFGSSVTGTVLYVSSLLMFKEYLPLEMLTKNTSPYLKNNCLKFYLFIRVM